MKKYTHDLYVNGFNHDGLTGTIKDKNGKPIYNIDTENLTYKGCIMSNKILAVDAISLKANKYKVEARSINDMRGDIYSFDINFSVNTDGDKESVAIVRLNEEQVKNLLTLLEDRHKSQEV